MKKRKVGIMTFSDGREFVHERVRETNEEFERRLVERLEGTGEVNPVTADEQVWSVDIAKRQARKLASEGCGMTIFNFAVWSFPHFTSLASEFAPSPFLLFSNLNPKYPGMVGMLAAAGALDQIGQFHARIWGDIRENKVLARVMEFIRGATVARRLRGETYGLFGGRSMGMYTAVSNLDQWRKEFGIDIEHTDQMEIVRLAKEVPEAKAENALKWIEEKSAGVHYDGKRLTPEILKKQIRAYYAIRRVIKEKSIDFVGIKSQTELSDHFATMDVPEAFLNDPYDWDGPHEPIVCATEADADGALTMEILKHITGEPVLFVDVRHYYEDRDLWDLCNSGQHTTYYANRSYNPDENMRRVEFYPEGFYFPAGGATVKHIAHHGRMTMARLARKDGEYTMWIVPGEIVDLPKEEADELAKQTDYNWPHAFVRFEADPEELISNYPCNHGHLVYGDRVGELVWAAKSLNVDYEILPRKHHPKREKNRGG